MTNACEKWKDPLLEAALTGAVAQNLEEHLRGCKECTAKLTELKARRTQMDALLPLVVQSAQPSTDFRARVLGAAEAKGSRKRASGWLVWTLGGATVTAAAVLALGLAWHQRTRRKAQLHELAVAQELAEWHAPSDTLLATPGQEILHTMPQFGGPDLRVSIDETKED
jgi:hypothetical protein